VPGSNRRFPAFDRILALDADGFSDYWGISAALERRSATGVSLRIDYTYSRATDNWLSGRAGGTDAQLTPFPAGLNGGDWAKGPSDFDIPHNLSAGLALPISRGFGPRLGVLYRYHSGYPFTPGFRDGVDLNGDGSGRNDPAYVDQSIPGTTSLYGAWPCLQQQAGQLAGRNSCREPGVHALDVRLSMAPFRSSSFAAELVIDALNLVESDVAVRDRALYLVDPARTLATNATTGVVTVPLLVNPNFGQPLIRRTTGRTLRVGLRISH